MLTVREAARRAGRDPDTISAGSAGRLRSQKVGARHVLDEHDLEALLDDDGEMLPLPDAWRLTADGKPMPNVVAAIRRSRGGH
jgi:hypothetical protein